MFKTLQQTPNFRENELFVDFVKGVNKPVDCIAVAPHAREFKQNF